MLALAMCLGSEIGSAASIDFDLLGQGEVVNSQFVLDGVTISAINPHRSFDLAIAFDTNADPATSEDPDLTAPFSVGNATGNDFGIALIVSETSDGGSGFVAAPDDEAAGPGSTLVFEFETAISSFGFDALDIEEPAEAHLIRFYSGDALLKSLTFADLMVLDPTIVFGDSSANRFAPIEAESDGWNRVEVEFGGSGGLDNLLFTPIPEPGSVALVSLGLIGLAIAGRKPRS